MKAILVTLGVVKHADDEWGAHGYITSPTAYQPVNKNLTSKDKHGSALPYVMVHVRDDLSASCDNYMLHDIVVRSMQFASYQQLCMPGRFAANNKNNILVEYHPPVHPPRLRLKTANAGYVMIEEDSTPVFIIYPLTMSDIDVAGEMSYVKSVHDYRGVYYRPNGVLSTKAIAAIPCIDEPRHHIDITTKILSFIKTIPAPSEVHTLDKLTD